MQDLWFPVQDRTCALRKYLDLGKPSPFLTQKSVLRSPDIAAVQPLRERASRQEKSTEKGKLINFFPPTVLEGVGWNQQMMTGKQRS